MKTSFAVALAFAAAVALGWPERSAAYDFFYDQSCAQCHGPTRTCSGCHAHGAHGLANKQDMNVAATANKASFTAGEEVVVTVTGGYRCGWVRMLLLDGQMATLAESSGPGGLGNGPDSCTAGGVTLRAPAPSAPGRYTWYAAWYGNTYDLDDRTTGAVAAFGPNYRSGPGVNHGRELFPLTVTVVAGGAPAAALAPTSLAFPRVKVGATSPLSARIQNTGSAVLKVTGISRCDDAAAAPFSWALATPVSIAPGGEATLAVTYQPTAAASSTSCLRLATNDPANPTLQLGVSGAADPAPPGVPGVAVSASTLSFGSGVLAGTYATRTFDVQSVGTANLDVSGIAPCAGTGAGMFTFSSSLPGTIAPAEARTVKVSYTPTAAGTHSGCLTVETSAGPIDVRLSGAATMPAVTCTSCHGGKDNATGAPPSDTSGESAVTRRGVGAHSAHLNTQMSPTTAQQSADCTACHQAVPSFTSPLHRDGSTDVPFGGVSKAKGLSPSWNPQTPTCGTVYCHGATLAEGTNTAPTWTSVGAGEAACGRCHGVPPVANHPSVTGGLTACVSCHPETMTAGGTLDPAGKHINGIVETAGCTSCHGSSASPAPPADTQGGTATTAVSVGAHQQHVTANAIAAPIACTECHGAASGSYGSGHANGTVEVSFGALANTGVTSSWNRAAETCATYCHGGANTPLQGGTATAPIWTRVDGTQASCGSCHGFPPPAPHSQSQACESCHPATVKPGGAIDLAGGKHLDGVVEYDTSTMSCSSCHGTPGRTGADPLIAAAPPTGTKGETATTTRAVGAHLAHLQPGTLSKGYACTDCHNPPTAMDHSNRVVEMSFSALAKGSGAPLFDGTTCASTYCHGNFTNGNAANAPTWTGGVSQVGCTSCHGSPPGGTHPVNSACGNCHPGSSASSVDPVTHADGHVDLLQTCTSCHGTTGVNAAPPKDTKGQTATTLVSVGAHQVHAATTLRAPIDCAECHGAAVASYTNAHPNSTVEMAFGALSNSLGGATVWNRTAATCASNACHGAVTALKGGTATMPVWTRVDGTQKTCGSCHGNPPPASSGHVQRADCGSCHAGFTNASVNVATHVNGVIDYLPQTCTTCHGTSSASYVAVAGADANVKAAPPVDSKNNTAVTAAGVGVHQVHVNGSRSKPVACAECHAGAVPAASQPIHANGTTTVAFGTLSKTGGVAPAYAMPALTCASTYCHGNFTGGAGAAATPAWTAAGTLGCTACHGNPPTTNGHPANTACADCHGAGYSTTTVNAATHVDGLVTLPTAAHPAGSCTACHGDATKTVIATADANAKAAPPVGARGETATTTKAVGVHAAHLNQTTYRAAPIACSECHAVPAAGDRAHANGSAAVAFGTLSRTGNITTAAWNATTLTCASTYCHGNFKNGNTTAAPSWTAAGSLACASCHGSPPGGTHPVGAACGSCHEGYTATTVNAAIHLNGIFEPPIGMTCASCHGDKTRVAIAGGETATNAQAAPPIDAKGNSAVTARGVGLHQLHVAGGRSKPQLCSECHVLPTSMTHSDGVSQVALRSGTFDGTALTCASTYCHGNFTGGAGTAATPAWTAAGTLACTSCHGNPPAAPHPQDAACADCHGAGYTTTTVNAATHVDGAITLPTAAHPAGSCTACHGDATKVVIATADANAKAAPPIGTRGETATTAKAVGAHAAHLNQTTFRPTPIGCAECHGVPAAGDKAHANNASSMPFGTLAKTGGAPATYNATTLSCATVYCHGGAGGTVVVQAGSASTPSWTGTFTAGVSSLNCGSCHPALPTANGHPQRSDCGTCHGGASATAYGSANHLNGVIDVLPMTCATCHGNASVVAVAGADQLIQAAPPLDTKGNGGTTAVGVGVHQAHVNTTRAKPVACAACHAGAVPLPTAMQHANGVVTVAFGGVSTTGGVLPSYQPAGGSCAATYCHGNFTGGAGSIATPPWVSAGTLGCASCHGNPPALPHPQDLACADCHGAGYSTTTVNAATHVDGLVTLPTAAHPAGTCSACHGDATKTLIAAADPGARAAPPIGTRGETATTTKAVGAHAAHLNQTTFRATPVACAECHGAVATGDKTHANGTAAIAFGSAATYRGALPAWNAASLSCSSVYCHGNFTLGNGNGAGGGTATAPTAAPTGMAFSSVAASSLGLSWAAVTGATAYKVERAPNNAGAPGTFVQVGTASGTSYADAGLAASTTYWYRVRATNGAGDGPYSASASQATTAAGAGTVAAPTAAPTGVAFSAVVANSLTVGWSAVTGATAYKVERAPNNAGAAGTFVQVGTAAGTSYADAGLTASTTYWYRVRATNDGGDGPYSANASRATAAASTGGTGTATRYDLAPATATSVGLDGSTNVTSQTSYDYNNPAQTFRALGVAGYTPSSTQGRLRASTALSANTTYSVVNLYTPALTTSNAAVAANVPVSIDYYVRTGASNSTATIRAVLYEYNATTGNVGAAKGTYTSPTINTSSSTSSFTTLTGTIPNAAFTAAAGNRLKVVFQVVTGSTGGNDVAILFGATRSGTSGQTFITPTLGGSTGTTPTAPTAAPTTLAFTNVAQTTLSLGWSAVTGATHYKVERAPNVSGAPGTFVQVGTTATTSFGNAGLAANTTYWYRVRAWNAGGDGPYSANASQTTTAPAATAAPTVAPTTLAFGSVAPTSLSLSWAAASGATHYKVERAPDLSGAPGTFAQVGTTATASYGDAGLAANTRYWYRVRGWNAGGDGPYSASASQATAAVAPPTGGISWTGTFTPGTSSLNCQSCHGMPPAGTHPTLAAGANCGGCHGGYNALVGATTGVVNASLHLNASVDPPPGGEPTAATSNCGGCHGAILNTMNGTTAKASKHTLGTDASADAAVSWTGTSLTGSVAAASRSCTTMCHADHPHGTTTHNANVYADATTQTTRAAAKIATDFDATQASGGLCTSCHQKPVDAASPAQRPAVTKADYQGKAHDFVQNVVGTTTNAWQYTLHDSVGAFQRNCTKCHASQAEGQTPTIAANGSGNVGPHASDFGQLLAGLTNPGATPANFVCYNCHGDNTTGKNLSGKVLVTDAAKAQGHGGFLNSSATHDTAREAAATYNSGAYSGTNRHANCVDCHDEHRAGKTKHTPGPNDGAITAASPLYGVSGVGYTGTLPANWAAIPSTNLAKVAVATAEYQICFKCHTGFAFGTTPPTGPSTLAETDLAQEWNVNNRSVHPVVNTLANQTGSTAKGLVASQLLAPWNTSPGSQTMTCSDCHNSDAASTAAQGPHGSAVRFMLSGTNKAWPYTVAGATSGTLFRVATSETGLNTANGLFCRNCHPQMNSTGSNSLHRNSNVTGGQHGSSTAFACTGCHIRIPHGGKVSRLLVTTAAPARYKVGTPIFSSITKGATKDSYSTSAYPTGFARSCSTHSSTAGAEAW